ncbi:MAG: tetratricopeptide repeat protein [Myxococcaceae bacterium]|nr:tetratricopeptide repeat protein [Myxococcaceae bacterium]
MRMGRWSGVVVALAATGLACTGARTNVRPDHKVEEIRFEPIHVTGDPELEKLNDEELMAGGEAAYAAEDYKKAARYFGRLADFFPDSRHRRAALYNAGLAHERVQEWEDAYMRFNELSDPEHGTGDALDAAFRVAETLYHLDRYDEAADLLHVIAERTDLGPNKRIEAQVQYGICTLEAGRAEEAESILRKALAMYNALEFKEEVDDYFPAQAQFFIGEIYRLRYESVQLDPLKGTDELAKDLEYKAELLLSAQGHYLRAIRMGNGQWATAAGAQIGMLYENLYEHMVSAPVPPELNAEEAEIYRQELRKKIRVLITKAINVYERTLEAAERIGAQNPFVERTRQSLKKMKELLLADARSEEAETSGESSPPPAAGEPEAGPHS